MTRYERQFRSVARSLGHVELMRSSLDDALGLDHRDLLDKDAGRRFLDFYGDEGIRLAISRYGLEGAMHRRGYDHFELETRAADDRHTLLVFGRPAHEHPSPPTSAPASDGESSSAEPASALVGTIACSCAGRPKTSSVWRSSAARVSSSK